jgi:hypothetical protein
MKFINENMCLCGQDETSDFLNRPLHELLHFSPGNSNKLFCKLNIFLMLDELHPPPPPQLFHTSTTE